MPADLTNGTINGKLIINGEEYSFSFIYDGTKHLPAFPKGDGEKTLNSSSVRLTGETVIGYDGTIADLNVKSITPTGDGHGGTYFMIGSYGVYYRGSGFRFAIINSSGNYAEYSPRTEIIYPLASFNAGVKFGLSIMIKDDNTITVSVYINDALQGSYDVPRSENEISGEEAKFSVEITSYVTSLTINGEL